jgi:hypothetical protein
MAPPSAKAFVDLLSGGKADISGVMLPPPEVLKTLPGYSANVDPVLAPFKQHPVTGRLAGYAGSPTQKAAEVETKYIIVDMYAKGSSACHPRRRSKGLCGTGQDLHLS